ncbi:recombinase family protein [Anaerocolumna sedimenticola]|uniref:Recombinase family protein n=1 Tax=Anaerocolumna sedimenticola TaxID=2696063 RepID=A0A6P1TJF7_9FIRM|nr:recombinase family protein [Anaerocolumna sedimenticola]QHQ60046.1 recombinase family protein [Anaerocolumna sedimenticola]
MKAVAYCRVSTNKDEQLDSLESQQNFFAEYAARNAYELVNIYADEGKSGTKIKNRTQLLKLLADAGLGKFEIVLIKDISRLARNTVDFLTSIRKLKALNIRVIFVNYDQTSSDSSEFMLTMLSAIAQEESANTSKRVRFGKKQNAEHGRVPNLIYGYDKIPGDYFHLNINQEEAAVVSRIYDLYTNKNLGTNRIASILNQEGIRTKRNCSWTQNAVNRILSNEIYVGKVINGKQEIEDFLTGKRKSRNESQWMIIANPDLRIISDAVFIKAKQIRNKRMNAFPKDTGSSRYILSQLVKCKCCGSTFRRLVRTYKNTYVTWVCNGRNSNGTNFCSNTTSIDEIKLLDSIKSYFITILKNNPETCRNFLKEYNKKLKRKERFSDKEKENAARINKLNREKQKYMEMYANDILTMEELKNKINSIYEKIKECRQTVQEIRKIYNPPACNLELPLYLEELFKDSNAASVLLLRNLLDRIEVDINGNIDIYLGVYSDMKEKDP